MFLIPSDRPPASLPELRALLSASLERTYGVTDADRRLVIAGRWPRFEEVRLDLTGVGLDPLQPPPAPGRFSPPSGRPTLQSAQLRVGADPLRLGAEARLQFAVAAGGVDLSFVRDDRGQLWLLPHHFASGQVTATIAGRDLERVFLEGAQGAAARHGVSIEDGNLQLRQADARSVTVTAELEARRLFVRGRLALRGRVTVDAALNLSFSELTCEGRGAIGSIASRFVRPHLETWEGQPIPLLAMALPAVRLHHAELRTDAEGLLHAAAEFGEGAASAAPLV
jgi:hypothetical protein